MEKFEQIKNVFEKLEVLNDKIDELKREI